MPICSTIDIDISDKSVSAIAEWSREIKRRMAEVEGRVAFLEKTLEPVRREIAITDEMLRAGAALISDAPLNASFEADPYALARSIYVAMEEKRQRNEAVDALGPRGPNPFVSAHGLSTDLPSALVDDLRGEIKFLGNVAVARGAEIVSNTHMLLGHFIVESGIVVAFVLDADYEIRSHGVLITNYPQVKSGISGEA